MTELFIFLAGALIGGVVTAVWISMRNRWTKARSLLDAPDKAKSEGRAKIKEAKGKAAKARFELLRLGLVFLLFFLVMGAVLFAAAMALL